METESPALLELIFRYVHISCGGLALIGGLLAMISKKGKKLHIWSGRVYFWSMAVVFITSLYLSYVIESLFLLMVGVFSFYLVFSGLRNLKLKSLAPKGERTQPKHKAGLIDWGGMTLAGLFSISLLVWGIYGLLSSGNGMGIVAIVFGVLGGLFSYGNLKKFLGGPSYKLAWLNGHIAGMVGGYIATLSAFLVTNADFLPPIVNWLGPTIIGTPLIILWTRKFAPRKKKKAKETDR